MPFFRRDPEKALADSHEKMVNKLADKGDTLASVLRSEMAAARTNYAMNPIPATPVSRAAGDRWVTEEAMGLESSRPDRRGRRAVDQDPPPVRGPSGRNMYRPERLFAIGGIFSADRRDALGRVDRERWPGETQPERGGGCSIPGCAC